jgi:cell division protein FtsW
VRNRESKLSKQTKSVDRKLLFLILAFVAIGLIAVADVSAPQALNSFGDKFFLFKQQLEWAGIGLVVFFITSKVKYTFWEKIATPLFMVSLILLLLVLLPHLGFSTLGARRWVYFGPINFQPAEFVKFAICIYFAKLASRNKGFASYFISLGIIILLVMLQPDLGTTLILVMIAMSRQSSVLWPVFH